MAAIKPHEGPFFLPYQKRWIEDESRLKLMEKSRRVGISFSTAYGCCRRVSLQDERYDTWVTSRDELQAREFIQDCKPFAKVLDAAAKDLGELVIDEKKKASAFVIQFANGKRIHSMSSNPDAQAGKGGTRVLDEFALHAEQRKLYSIASPGIEWGGQLEIISTHRGSYSYFNELIQEIKHKGNPKGFALHRVTIVDAVDQGFLEKLQHFLPDNDPRKEMDRDTYLQYARNTCSDEESWLQEYMCVPADDASAFLPYELITTCEYKLTEEWETDLGDCKNPLYMGVDVGRQHDLTVFWINEKFGGMDYTRRVICLYKMPFSAQEDVFYELLKLPQMRRCCVDNTGLGMQFAERAQQRFGTYKVEPVTFTGPVKEELAYPVRAAFEDHTIRIPNNKDIRADLRSIRKETTASGNIRFTADRGKNGHADRFWALALALFASKKYSGDFSYQTPKRNFYGSTGADTRAAMRRDRRVHV